MTHCDNPTPQMARAGLDQAYFQSGGITDQFTAHISKAYDHSNGLTMMLPQCPGITSYKTMARAMKNDS